jgi:hypothetical protein
MNLPRVSLEVWEEVVAQDLIKKMRDFWKVACRWYGRTSQRLAKEAGPQILVEVVLLVVKALLEV